MNQDLFIQRTNQIRELKSSLLLGLDDVQEWILTSPSTERTKISPFRIQMDTGISYKKATAILVAGTLTGAFQMHWNYNCPMCGATTSKYHSLAACKQTSFCEMCNKEFDGDLQNNVIVNFSLHPEIEEPSSETLVNSEEPQLTGLELLHIAEFKEFFGSETIDPREKLTISSVTILFTDIKGSTQLYEALGDLKAFELVREHFQLLTEAIQNNSGVLVKTIGDSIMASFVNSSFAVHSIFRILEKFKVFNMPRSFSEQIHLKIGLHEGPAILVNLNDKIDYFGTTVNKAARIQSIASPEEICISEELFTKTEIQEVLKVHGIRRVKRSKHVLKGLSGNHSIIKIPIQP